MKYINKIIINVYCNVITVQNICKALQLITIRPNYFAERILDLTIPHKRSPLINPINLNIYEQAVIYRVIEVSSNDS